MKRVSYVCQKFNSLYVEKMIYEKPESGRARTKCECLCDCGNRIITTIDSVISGKKTSCGCQTKQRRINNNRRDLTGRKFGRLTVLKMLFDDTGKTRTKVHCICDCGNEITVLNTALTRGSTQSCGCLQREVASKINTKDWSNICSDYGVTLLTQLYQNDKGQWVWECQCGLCGNHFEALPAKIMNGHITSCGCRKTSSKEQYIETLLKDNNIQYISQYSFDDCRYNDVLKFDFAVFKEQKLWFLIEYDGRQHYMPVDRFGGENEFNVTQIRDSIKTNYCNEHNISLLRLPYTLTDQEIKKEILNVINAQRL